MEEFFNIFGPELKSVTGDPKRIDDVLARVESLVTPFEKVTLYPFLSNVSSEQFRHYTERNYKFFLEKIYLFVF